MNSTVDPILAIAILVNILKPAIAITVPPASQASDSLIRALALALGIAGELIAASLTHTISQATLNDALGRGFGHGILAILLYHLVASKGPENALEDHATGDQPALADVVPAMTLQGQAGNTPPQAGA